MVIVINPFGSNSNRLFQTVHIESFCKDHKISFFNPSLYDISGYFTGKTSMFDKIIVTLLKKLIRFKLIKIYTLSTDQDDSVNFSILQKRPFVCIEGWVKIDKDITDKYKPYFRNKFTVKIDDSLGNYQSIASETKRYERVVGVHIRRGDYKFWENGAYFFDDAVYLSAMDKMQELLKDKETLFIIFSNEQITIPQKYNSIVSKNQWFIDQKLMSECDYLIGPPSTFTLWASYVGKAKYYPIKNPDLSGLLLDDFEVCRG